jgi:hypothetical protein
VNERLERQARNESLTRTVNEQVATLDARTSGWAGSGELFDFHCECGRGDGCDERLQMTLAEYEIVRQQQDRFAVAPGHEAPELEVVVVSAPRFLIVDKRDPYERFVGGDRNAAR